MLKNEKIRNDIIEVLKKATEPMGRGAIVAALAKAGKASDAELPLRQMKDEGLIKQTGERRTAVYKLTAKGQKSAA